MKKLFALTALIFSLTACSTMEPHAPVEVQSVSVVSSVVSSDVSAELVYPEVTVTSTPAPAPVSAPAPVVTVAPVAPAKAPDVVPAPVAPAPAVVAPVAPPVAPETLAAPVAPAECMEDEPCWDCATMGNGICGPDAETLAAIAECYTDAMAYSPVTRECVTSSFWDTDPDLYIPGSYIIP